MVVDRGVLEGSPMKKFRVGIRLVIYFWWEIRCFVERGLDDDSNPRPKVEKLCRRLFEWFLQSKVPPSVPSAKMKLKELISFFEVDLIYLDNSLEEVSEQLVVMYHECLQGDFSSVEIILQANLGLARHLVRPNVVKDNSSLTDASGVFREGIGLVMENLWVRRVFIHHLCRSNPRRMLQQLANDILFWFTQTIKPLSFAYLERILRDELYSLPIDYQFATNGITKEVASTLMRMHQECLQGSFSSVQILREESLNQDKGMLERFGVAPLVAALPVNHHKESEEREKIRVAWQKEREKERILEAKDAAMGKKSKISRDRDCDISEELDLGYASTRHGTTFLCDGMLFNLDTRMSNRFSTDDQYNVYDKGLFTAQPTLSTLYTPKNDVYKGFTGASEMAHPRDRPVEFESKEADSCSTSCNEKVSHWVLTIIDPENEKVYYLDPIRRRLPLDSCEWKTVVNSAIGKYNEYMPRTSLKAVEWKPITVVPHQPDAIQCGYYVMRYMRDIVEDKDQFNFVTKWSRRDGGLEYTQAEIDVVRNEWAKFIVSTYV
ncbi:hypothetical protein OROHE_004589 [Orobanche hederae]